MWFLITTIKKSLNWLKTHKNNMVATTKVKNKIDIGNKPTKDNVICKYHD